MWLHPFLRPPYVSPYCPSVQSVHPSSSLSPLPRTPLERLSVLLFPKILQNLQMHGLTSWAQHPTTLFTRPSSLVLNGEGEAESQRVVQAGGLVVWPSAWPTVHTLSSARFVVPQIALPMNDAALHFWKWTNNPFVSMLDCRHSIGVEFNLNPSYFHIEVETGSV